MDILGTTLAAFFATLTFSVLALPFSVLPPGAVALALKAKDEKWVIAHLNVSKEHKVRYVVIGIAGGLLGEFFAIASLFFGEQWICFRSHELCHDGQGGLLLIFTVPVFSFFGSALLIGWTWLRLRVPGHSRWAATARYSGQEKISNMICASTSQLALFGLFAFFVFRLTLAIL